MTNLTNGGTKDAWEKSYTIDEMKNAMAKTVTQILELQHNKLGSKAAPNSLNFCTTDGSKLLAIRFRNHESQQPPSLYWSEFAGRTLNTKYPGNPDANVANDEAQKSGEEMGRHTIISSEPTTYDESQWYESSR